MSFVLLDVVVVVWVLVLLVLVSDVQFADKNTALDKKSRIRVMASLTFRGWG